MGFIRYYGGEINKSVPIRDALSLYMGVRCGNRKYIRCPSPDHDDKRPSAAIYDNNNICKCYSCGAVFTPLKVVMTAKGCGYREACRALIDDFALDGRCFEEQGRNGKKGREENGFPLTVSELRDIGLCGAMSSRTDDGACSPTILDAWKEDRTYAEELLDGKCGESLKNAEALAEACGRQMTDMYAMHGEAYWDSAEKIYDAWKGCRNAYITELRNRVGSFERSPDGRANVDRIVDIKRASASEEKMLERIADEFGIEKPQRITLSQKQQEKCVSFLLLCGAAEDLARASDGLNRIREISEKIRKAKTKEKEYDCLQH